YAFLSSQPPPVVDPAENLRYKVVPGRVSRPQSYGKQYYECPCLKLGTQDRGCGYFMWKDDLIRRLSFSLGPSAPPSSSLGPSTHLSCSPLRSTLNLRKAECSNCNFLAEKIKALEMKINILEGTLEMERHSENHTLESAAILYELYNDIGKLSLD
nr:hypothetical protein [Tanacetum cinerariifolium]